MASSCLPSLLALRACLTRSMALSDWLDEACGLCAAAATAKSKTVARHAFVFMAEIIVTLGKAGRSKQLRFSFASHSAPPGYLSYLRKAGDSRDHREERVFLCRWPAPAKSRARSISLCPAELRQWSAVRPAAG